MSTLPEITEALCKAVAEHDVPRLKQLSYLAADKMGGQRAENIRRAFERSQPIQLLKYWMPIHEERHPWTPPSVSSAIDQWLLEGRHREELVAAGEKVRPLLLTGETRCGKTSSICGLAKDAGLSVVRLSVPSVQGGYLGEYCRKLGEAFFELRTSGRSYLWILDEIDAVSQHRLGDSGASQERTTGVATLLTEIENLPPWAMVAATSNVSSLIDSAILARFTVVKFPAWGELAEYERAMFCYSHGYDPNFIPSELQTYSDAVQAARQCRVAKILESVQERCL